MQVAFNENINIWDIETLKSTDLSLFTFLFILFILFSIWVFTEFKFEVLINNCSSIETIGPVVPCNVSNDECYEWKHSYLTDQEKQQELVVIGFNNVIFHLII